MSTPTVARPPVVRRPRPASRAGHVLRRGRRRHSRWPDVGDRSTGRIDWFDAFARGNDRPALVIVEEDGSRAAYSFDEMVPASDQVAAWLAEHGRRRGRRGVVMLGNQVELWETMLAVMKLGAVIMPTTTAVGPGRPGRPDRARRSARRVVCNAADAAKFDEVPGDYIRIVVGAGAGGLDGRTPRRTTRRPCRSRTRAPPPGDRLLLYFTSGTTSRPKLVEHTQVVLPGRAT